MHVLYLIFNEGYTASSGAALQRMDLSNEALRLGRLLHQLVPDEGEVSGLLALMLLVDARRSARTSADGSLVPLAEQQRSLWNTAQINEGVALLTRTLGTAPAAMLFNEMTTKIALGAVVTRAPALTDFDADPLELIATGDWVTVDADRGVVEVRKARRASTASTSTGDDRR
jgi:predicted RNA polymerase sigma factor